MKILKLTPKFFFKYSSFVSESNCKDILQDAHDIFQANKLVDHDLYIEKNKIEGYIRNLIGERCHFTMKLYNHQNGEILVEFQRLEGCTVFFTNFYYDMLYKLAKRGHFIRRGHISIGVVDRIEDVISFKLPQAPFEDFEEIDVKQSVADMNNLLSALTTESYLKNLDIQRQSMSILLNWSTSTKLQKILHESEHLHVILTSGFSSGDLIVQEYSTMIVLNMCSYTLKWNTSILNAIKSMIKKPKCLESRFMQRNAITVLKLAKPF